MRLSHLTTILALCSLSANAQTGADYMKAMKVAGNDIMFDVNAEGKEYKVNWGMDAAWDWDYNVYRGIAHVGVGNFATGRVSFQPVDLVIDNGDGTYSLTERQKKKLKYRCDLIKMTGTTQVNLNCDHEALFCQVDEDGNYPVVDGVKPTDYTGRTNYQGKPEAWYKLIKASAQYVESLGLPLATPIFTLRADAGVEGDAVDPCRDAAVGAEAVEAAPDVEKGILTEVLKLLLRPREGQADACDEAALIARDIDKPSLRLAPPGSIRTRRRHQLGDKQPDPQPERQRWLYIQCYCHRML